MASLLSAILALALCAGVTTAATVPDGYTPLTPPAGPDNDQSAWFDAQKQRAASRLNGSRFDVLVVPFQVVNDGLDPAARSLMTLSLGEGIRRRTGLSVATPSLVAQALGLNRRTFSDDEIEALAADLGVRHVLVGAVGQAGPGTFRYQVRIADVAANGKLADRRFYVSDTLPLDDVRIPYEQFLGTRDALIAAAFSGAGKAVTEPVTRERESLPTTLADVIDADGTTAIERAHRLQFLAMLMPDQAYSLLQQHLYARSLVMLERADPDSSDYAVLRARALLHLHRRPATMMLLGTERSPAGQALRAYANGNSTELASLAPEIEPGLLAFAGKLDGDRLRLQYGGTPDSVFAEALLEQNATWGLLMYAALNDRHPWRQYSAAPVKLTLEQTHPNAALSIETFLTAKLAVGELVDEYSLTELTLRHMDRVDKAAKAPPDTDDPLAATLADYVEVLREMLPADVAAQARHLSASIGKPEAALELLDQYEDLFSGYPAILNSRLAALSRKAQKDHGNSQALFQDAGLKAAGRQAIRVPGGVNVGNAWMQHNRGWYFDDNDGRSAAEIDRRTYASDWPAVESANDVAFRTIDDQIRSLAHCLAYTLTEVDCLTRLAAVLVVRDADGGVTGAKQLLADNSARFLGHPNYLESMNRALAAVGDDDATARLHRVAVENGTPDWSAYDTLGRALIRQAQYEEALDVALKYPGFNGEPTQGAVGISGAAYEFGSQLYWAGAYEQARPLFVIATMQPTGSAADMGSAQRLALLDGDYVAAQEHASRRVRRYSSEYGLRDVMGLLVLNGALPQALSVADGFAAMLNKAATWDGALTVLRADKRSAQDVAAWGFDDERASVAGNESLLPLRLAFLAYTLDRKVDGSLAEMLRSRDRREPLVLHNGRHLKRGGRPAQWPSISPNRNPMQARPANVSQDLIDQMPDSPMKFLLQPSGPSTAVVDELTDYAARALAALEAGDDAKAYAELHEASEFHELREFLPYYALVAARTSQTQRIARYLRESGEAKRKAESNGNRIHGLWFDDYLASAALEGGTGQHASALNHLARANATVRHNEERFVYTRYQVLEIARLLYLGTNDDRYRSFAHDLASRYAVIEPAEAYPHSFVAMLSNDRRERVVALARVLLLDPHSRSLDLADASELAEATNLAKAGFPPLKGAASDT